MRRTTSIDRTGSFGGGVTAHITQVRAVTAGAGRPGEIAGPAVAVYLQVDNHSSTSIDTSNPVVNLYYGTGKTPGLPSSSAPSRLLPRSIGAGRSGSAVYVFDVPTAQRSLIYVEVSYAPTAAVVTFRGAAR